MITKFSTLTGWVTFIKYRGVACWRDWGHVKPTRKQLRKLMKRLRVKIQ